MCSEAAEWLEHQAQPSVSWPQERECGWQEMAPVWSHPHLTSSPAPARAEEDINKADSLLCFVSQNVSISRTFFKQNASSSQTSDSQAFIIWVYPEVLLVTVSGNSSDLIINKGPCEQILKSTVIFSTILGWNIIFHQQVPTFFSISMSSSSLFSYNKAVKINKCCVHRYAWL